MARFRSPWRAPAEAILDSLDGCDRDEAVDLLAAALHAAAVSSGPGSPRAARAKPLPPPRARKAPAQKGA